MASSGPDALGDLADLLGQAQRQFLELVAGIRPELHRYCTRMTGSVTDGEDVVQETLARACYELPQLKTLPPLRPWLFRIAHNLAVDHWRHERLRRSEPIEVAEALAADALQEPDALLARSQAVSAAIGCFLALAPAQRGCVILKDVLDHSLEEIGAELGLSVPAVKAALHRGRMALQEARAREGSVPARPEPSAALVRYATLFNARDWDGVRALLADDVRLDLVSRRKAAGRRDVEVYFGNYERAGDWHLQPAWLEGREVLAVVTSGSGERPRYFIELAWHEDRVIRIRDFRHVPYIAQEAEIQSNA